MNLAETTLLTNINNPNSLFIFPTDIAASRWADHLLRLMNESQNTTIAMNKFTAWDVFKQNSIKSKVQNKKSIPSALRKIFVSGLVKENADLAEQGKTPVFSSIIRPQWARQASRFAPWLTKILPQLGVWFNKRTGLSINSIPGVSSQLKQGSEKTSFAFDGDDKDMYTLAMRYSQFLEAHGLFEPAWETPPFNDEGNECFLFFPESLSDYNEYRELLSESSHVKIISASDSLEKSVNDTFFYTNSRSEITEASLYMRALNEKQGIAWDSIALCIPDSENYEPYVLRELTNRNIPFVKRTSKPLCDYPAGRFFNSVLDCASQDFSFSSLVTLVLNKNLPWKDTALIDQLIQFGIKNNCLYSWNEETDGKTQHINVWEDAFSSPIEHFDFTVRKFFGDLKNRVSSFRKAQTFSELRRQYFIFREQFFDMEICSEKSDLILSRCITELMNLVELEKSFPDVPAADPFRFFTEYLSEVYYLPQSKSSGVAILPYKTAAAAPFDCHIVLGAGQENLSVVYSRLDFLPRKKREELGLLDEDASAAFINMHKYNSVKTSAFFCCEKTFSGFAIPHTKIGAPMEAKDCYADDPEHSEKFSQDHYKTESSFYSSLFASASVGQTLHENQMNGFTEWKKRRLGASSNNKWKPDDEIQKIIKDNFAKSGGYSVSATSLQKYFQCSLKWLFGSVYKLENTQIETSLMAENISGLVYHAVLNNFFTELKNNGAPMLQPVASDSGLSLPDSYIKLLKLCIENVFNSFPSLKQGEKHQMSALTAKLLSAGKNDFYYHLEKCLAHFLSLFAGCVPAGSECNYRSERESYILNGFVDCVLKDTSGNYIIVDFKLKNMPDRGDCTMLNDESVLSDFQLPMYITLTEENENYSIFTALFYSIINLKPEVIIGKVSDINTEKTIPAKEENQIKRGSDQYNKIINEFNNKTHQFADEISTGSFTVFAQKNSDCRDCDYQRICRTPYIINRENNLLGKN